MFPETVRLRGDVLVDCTRRPYPLDPLMKVFPDNEAVTAAELEILKFTACWDAAAEMLLPVMESVRPVPAVELLAVTSMPSLCALAMVFATRLAFMKELSPTFTRMPPCCELVI